MAQYLVLIYGNEQRWENASAEEMNEIDAAHKEFRERGGAAILASGELEPSSTATSLRAGADGGTAITDGPFLETKEVVGGFYVIDVESLDLAISLTSGLAEVHHDHSGVQIQPMVDHSEAD